MGRVAAGRSGARSGFAKLTAETLESFGKITRRDETCKRKSWCAEEINYQQTCLQENQLSLHASQRKNNKTRDMETCNDGGFLPLCVTTNVMTPRRDMLGLK
jgi:hypothetical protein